MLYNISRKSLTIFWSVYMINEKINSVKLFLMDMDGTVYLGNEPIEGAFETLEYLRTHGRKICFLTNNSSRSYVSYIDKLQRVFNFHVSDDEIYTSVQATINYLNTNYKGKSIFLLAPPDVEKEFLEEGIAFDDEDPDIVVLAFDTTLTYDKVYKACKFIKNGKLYIATHPDNFCPDPICPMPDMGGFIVLIEKTIDKLPDVIIGKPYSGMAEAIRTKFGLKNEEIAMVGDRLYTDIRFGVDNGFNSILVLTGETTKDMLSESPLKPTLVLDTFADVLKHIE